MVKLSNKNDEITRYYKDTCIYILLKTNSKYNYQFPNLIIIKNFIIILAVTNLL